jgi:hypothetical protein
MTERRWGVRKALIIAALLALGVTTVALASQSSNYALTSHAAAAGGQRVTSPQYAAAYVVGQSIIGTGRSADYVACYGFKCAQKSFGPSRIYLPVIGHGANSPRDAFEPDDAIAQAKSITTDGVVQTRNFYPAGDVDWVRLPVGPGTYVIATNVSNNLYPDTVLTLYAANGSTPLGSNDDCTGLTRASCLTYTSSVSTTLYLKVTPYDTLSVSADSWYGLAVVRQ